MAGTAGCQRMGEFVEDRVPNLLLRIQGDKVPGEGDLPLGVAAIAEPDLRMVEMKRPIGQQSVLLQECDRQYLGLLELHPGDRKQLLCRLAIGTRQTID
jgi:hypothetical protein